MELRSKSDKRSTRGGLAPDAVASLKVGGSDLPDAADWRMEGGPRLIRSPLPSPQSTLSIACEKKKEG